MLVKLKQIRPNPFRNMALYPIDEAKIDALKASFERTGYWGNIVARQSGDAFEIAYGHHRLTTMQRTMKPGDPVELIVRDISDADMLRMMADENMDEWRTSSEIEQETIRAVVLAYAEGRIELPTDFGSKARVDSFRNAPSFRTVERDVFKDVKHIPKPYNAECIAKFLGWMSGDQVSPRVRNALAALEAGEELEAPEEIAEITRGLSSNQARRTVEAVKQLRDAHQKSGKTERSASATAIKAGKVIAEKLRKEEGGVRDIKDIADAFKPREKKSPDVPDIKQYTENICGKLNALFRDSDDPLKVSLDELLKWKEYIEPEQQKKIVRMLFNVIGRCESLVSKFESEVVGRKVHLLTKE